MKKNPANAASIDTVTSSSARIPACAPLVCGESGAPKHTGHARATWGTASHASVISVIPNLLISRPFIPPVTPCPYLFRAFELSP
jgi:hypothetical protein